MSRISVQEAEKKFTEFLKGRQLKYTTQRQTILVESLKARGHFAADDLLDLSKKKDHTISKATLYRTLALLTDGKILEEHDFGRGRKVYERLLGHSHHDHMICVKCKKILEFENDRLEEIQEKEAKKMGFKIIFHSHKLFGLCRNCR